MGSSLQNDCFFCGFDVLPFSQLRQKGDHRFTHEAVGFVKKK